MPRSALIALLLTTILFSCKKDEAPVPPAPAEPTGTVKIRFYNKAGDSSLVLQTGKYVNDNSDTFYVNTLKYYISNIRLRKADNTEYIQPESYYLIDQSKPGSMILTIPNVPLGNYTGLSFMIGVDSTRNCSGTQTGALDPANAMFWTWNNGYIFFKMEGRSPQISSNYFFYHIGGFTGPDKTMRTIQPSFGSAQMTVQEIGFSEIGIDVNILEVFRTPNPISLATNYSIVSAGTSAAKIADNYSDMFAISYIHN